MQGLLRGAVIASSILLTLVLAGCGDQEADQRKAFISFLQNRVIDRPGIRVPQPTEDEKKSFGPYAEHYAVITDFHKVMDSSVSPKLSAAMKQGTIQSVGDLVTRHADLEGAKAAIDQMRDALDADLAQADAAHGKLKQPDDLKAIFDKAYERQVTAMASAFRDIVPVLDKILGEAVDMGSYIESHKDRIKISGPTLEVSDPGIQNEINARIQTFQNDEMAAQAAQNKFRSLIYGNPVPASRP